MVERWGCTSERILIVTSKLDVASAVTRKAVNDTVYGLFTTPKHLTTVTALEEDPIKSVKPGRIAGGASVL